MKSINKLRICMMLSMLVSIVGVSPANATLIGGQNWADEVASLSGNLQNYNGTAVGAAAADLVLGAPDSDVDGNGNAWDSVDKDNVVGWKGSGNASFTLYFETALMNLDGDDLAVAVYGGSKCQASIYGSIDGIDFFHIGNIVGSAGQIPGRPGVFHEPDATGLDRFSTLDFGSLNNLNYIRFDRAASGQGSGMFFDALGSVPEPGTFLLLIIGGLGLLRSREQA